MREETKARLDHILDSYEQKQLDFLRQHELTKRERKAFLDGFNRKIKDTIRPCFEELGQLMKLRGHGFEITQKSEKHDLLGNTESAYIKMEILPNGARADAGERPTISFVANSIRKEIWTQVSTIMSGCAGQRSVFSLDEITETVVEEEVLSVLGSCFG
ncbi:MAG: hypothetical protein ABFD97_13500 [Syntrophobacter sp.]